MNSKTISVLENAKRFRRNSDYGYMLSDADVILAICFSEDCEYEVAERIFNTEYKRIKL